MRYGKPIKNKKRVDPRYFLNEAWQDDIPHPTKVPNPVKLTPFTKEHAAALGQEVDIYVVEKSGRGAEDMYLKKGSHTDKPLWGGMDDDIKKFTGEVPGEAKLSAEVFIKQAGEAGVNVDGWRVEKL